MRKKLVYYLIGIFISILTLLFGNLICNDEDTGYLIEGEDPDNLIDGPYVFYDNDSTITVKEIIFGKDKYSPYSEKHKLVYSNPCILTCKKTGNFPKNFSFPLLMKHTVQPAIYEKPDKLIAISDIEGNFNTFYNLLVVNGVIDSTFNWTFDDGHLVLLGDFCDRGIHVTECLWLIYKMDQEAEKYGGKVHYILGNHEIMNLQNDTRYVSSKYHNIAEIFEIEIFELYDKKTEFGRWLRSKNVVEQIGENIYTHAGLTPELLNYNLSLEEINKIVRAHYDKPYKTLTNKSEKLKVLLRSQSPYWYRGYFMARSNYEKSSNTEIMAILEKYNAKTIIVGHTLMEHIESKYDGKVIAIDVPHELDHYKYIPDDSVSEALMIEKDTYYIIDKKGNKEKL